MTTLDSTVSVSYLDLCRNLYDQKIYCHCPPEVLQFDFLINCHVHLKYWLHWLVVACQLGVTVI